MRGRPEVLLDRRGGRKKLSVILIDWGVRESFHSLEYLNRQTTHRDDYELIWVEFYGHKPEPIRRATAGSRPLIDKWLVLGYPPDLVYHKHRAYNAGLLAASGEYCVVCDSDAIFQPTFVETILRGFGETPYAVIHLDEVRNSDQRFYPFCYPTVEQILGPGVMNWWVHTTKGLYSDVDRLHRANYGACMAARRSELLAIGGSDEHLDYLGFCCGPYEMTFRLKNRGRVERWLHGEYLYHTWHPNSTMFNTEYQAPHDGRFLPLRFLHARATGRVRPYQPNPCVRRGGLDRFLRHVSEHPEPGWVVGAQPTDPPDFAYQVDHDYRGLDLFVRKGEWFAVPAGVGFDPQHPNSLRADCEESLRVAIDSRHPDPAAPPGPGKLGRWVRGMFTEPLHRLPYRAVRKVRRRLTRTN